MSDKILQKRKWKRKYIIEWTIALILSISVLPILILLILFQKIFDNGPTFYISKRLGKNGQIFSLYKFRSMKKDAKEIRSIDNKLTTVANDSRITKYGAFLRLGFDELPQLYNVLKGDMCLIGPRPDLPEEKETYNLRQKMRLEVLPGITGLTQILDGRRLKNDDNLELDVRYVLYSTCVTDFKIALLTVPYSLYDKTIGRKYFKNYMTGIDESYKEKVRNEE